MFTSHTSVKKTNLGKKKKTNKDSWNDMNFKTHFFIRIFNVNERN